MHMIAQRDRAGGEADHLAVAAQRPAGFARNPNVAGYLFVGLGCETNQFEALFESQRARLGDLRLPP